MRFNFKDMIILLIAVFIFSSIRLSFGLGWKVYLVHFLIFAPFGIYLYFKGYPFFTTLIMVVALSAIGEISQRLFFNRIAEIIDVLVDSFSAGIGWLVVKFIPIPRKPVL